MGVDATGNRAHVVADALHSAAIHLLRGVRKEDIRAGVGPARLSVLSVLVFGGPSRLSDLARIEQVRPPTMSKIVAGLETQRLVRRLPDPHDARAYTIEATARGTKLLQLGRRRRVARLAKSFAHLDTQEIELLARAAAIVERISATI
jgi:DNA-binding MarR family transcriptional regulator